MDHTGDLTDLQRHRTDARQFIFRRYIGQGFHYMGYNSELMHGLKLKRQTNPWRLLKSSIATSIFLTLP